MNEPKHRVQLHQKHGKAGPIYPSEFALTIDGQAIDAVDWSLSHGKDSVARLTVSIDCVFETVSDTPPSDPPASPAGAEKR